MLPDRKIKCPHTGFSKTCFDGVTKHSCPKWIHVTGVNPNTGQQVDRYDCADAWTPMLLIENSQQQRQTAAAVESFRNEMVRSQGVLFPIEPALKTITARGDA